MSASTPGGGLNAASRPEPAAKRMGRRHLAVNNNYLNPLSATIKTENENDDEDEQGEQDKDKTRTNAPISASGKLSGSTSTPTISPTPRPSMVNGGKGKSSRPTASPVRLPASSFVPTPSPTLRPSVENNGKGKAQTPTASPSKLSGSTFAPTPSPTLQPSVENNGKGKVQTPTASPSKLSGSTFAPTPSPTLQPSVENNGKGKVQTPTASPSKLLGSTFVPTPSPTLRPSVENNGKGKVQTPTASPSKLSGSTFVPTPSPTIRPSVENNGKGKPITPTASPIKLFGSSFTPTTSPTIRSTNDNNGKGKFTLTPSSSFAPSTSPTIRSTHDNNGKGKTTVSPSSPTVPISPSECSHSKCENDGDCCGDKLCVDKENKQQCMPCISVFKRCDPNRPGKKECCSPFMCNPFTAVCDSCTVVGSCSQDSDCCSLNCMGSICQNVTKDATPYPTTTLFPSRAPTTPTSPTLPAEPIVPAQTPTPVPVHGTAVFMTAFLALAALFFVVRRRTKQLQYKTTEEVKKNRKFASRKSISTFMNTLERSKEDFFIDPRKLDLGRIIGIGSHGVVYEGIYQDQDVAVKELVLEDDEKEAKDSRQRFLQEMLALHRLRHPNIIRLIGVGALYSDDKLSRTFFFVMELAKCSLRDIMQDDTMRIEIATLSKSLHLAKQICDGLAYMHSKKLIHLDLKPENVLISENGVAKICDLGLSEVACASPKNPTGSPAGEQDPTMQELQGTSPYIAPELITDYRQSAPKYPVTFAADIYSFGIVLWELLHSPLSTHPLAWDSYRILVEVKYSNYRPKIDSSLPSAVVTIIRNCWSAVPAERPDPTDLSRSLLEAMQTVDNTGPAMTDRALAIFVPNELVGTVPQTRSRELSHSAML